MRKPLQRVTNRRQAEHLTTSQIVAWPGWRNVSRRIPSFAAASSGCWRPSGERRCSRQCVAGALNDSSRRAGNGVAGAGEYCGSSRALLDRLAGGGASVDWLVRGDPT
jgi:hypothetical protein